MKKKQFYNVHLDFNASFEITIDGDNESEAIRKAISEIYSSHALHPEVNFSYCRVLDDFGNTVKEYEYDRPDLKECVSTEDGMLIRLNQHGFNYE